jgi:cellulose synthase/poly-beta-1,6-N-acetylglucosamine synthase-like glycosyltransferase
MTLSLTAVVCTWNRAAILEGAIEALVHQEQAPPHEILIVDNGSRDHTGAIVQRWASRYPQITYLLEPRQGLSCARNAAVQRARTPVIAFSDDDVRVGRGWMAGIVSAFERWPQAAYVGGPVLPDWPAPVPAWLTPSQWAPLGVQDYGPEPVRADTSNPICLIGANVAFRREALEQVGEFNMDVQRVGLGPGSTEDHEMYLRLWRAGLHGMYDPQLRVGAIVFPERLRKAHHRAWHFGHGRHIARMRIPEMEASRAGRLLGVPLHLIRQAAVDGGGYLRSRLSGDAVRAFEREAHVWFIAGFVRERVARR